MVDGFEETEDFVTFCGVRMENSPGVFTPRILKSMKLGRYEVAELRHAERCLEPGDRVLDIGAGVGFLSTRIAQSEKVAAVLSVEANPALIDVIRSTFRNNGVGDKADCLHGIVGTSAGGESADFFVRKNFWASSLEDGPRAYQEKVSVPVLDFADLAARFRPTMIICDIEGGEVGLLRAIDIRSVSRVVIEVHPGIYGEAGLLQVFRALADQGFVLDIKAPRMGDVLTFRNVSPIS